MRGNLGDPVDLVQVRNKVDFHTCRNGAILRGQPRLQAIENESLCSGAKRNVFYFVVSLLLVHLTAVISVPTHASQHRNHTQ